MTGNTRYAFRTRYFERSWTWVRRGTLIVVTSLAILVTPFEEALLWHRLLAITLFTTYWLLRPKDDVAVDKQYFYYLRTSFLPLFSSSRAYDISQITSIRCTGIHNDTWELVDIFNSFGRNRGYTNSMEISFSDGSEVSMDLAISRDQLDKIIRMVYQFKKADGRESNRSIA